MPWRRRSVRADFTRALNIADLREIAQRRVPGFIFEYVEGGAEDEAALRRNRDVFNELRLIPNTLVDTSARYLRTEILGAASAAPLVIAPTGGNGLLHPDGDLALARAAARLGIPYTLSTVSTTLLEDIAKVGGRPWMQLYVMNDRGIAEDIMRRAAAAGFEALVFTTDANEFGRREWDLRSYRSPGRPTVRSSIDALRHPQWLTRVLLPRGGPRFRNLEPYLPKGAATAVGGSTLLPNMFKPTITWKDLEWIRRFWPRPLLIKGVLSLTDARRALTLGCDGLVLSNHGGRQLDHCVSSMDVLPEIASAVGDRLTLLVDGGFRRGTDIVKALCLGADAVMLGRATLYGLTAAGEPGVARALGMLSSEMTRTLGQLGCCSVAELSRAMIHAGKGG